MTHAPRFLPPGQVPDLPTSRPAPPGGAALPSSVLLPPPHVAAPAAGYDLGPWLVWGEEGFSIASDTSWW